MFALLFSDRLFNKYLFIQNNGSFFIYHLFKMILACPINGCQWQYNSDFNADQSFQIVNMHVQSDHAQQQSRQVAPVKAPKLIPPRIDVGIDQEAWVAFSLRWKQYCQGSNICPEMQSI